MNRAAFYVREPERNLTNHMSTVYHGDYAFSARCIANLADGHHQSGEVGDAAEAQHTSAGPTAETNKATSCSGLLGGRGIATLRTTIPRRACFCNQGPRPLGCS